MRHISQGKRAVVGQGLFESPDACRLTTVARAYDGAAVSHSNTDIMMPTAVTSRLRLRRL